MTVRILGWECASSALNMLALVDFQRGMTFAGTDFWGRVNINLKFYFYIDPRVIYVTP